MNITDKQPLTIKEALETKNSNIAININYNDDKKDFEVEEFSEIIASLTGRTDTLFPKELIELILNKVINDKDSWYDEYFLGTDFGLAIGEITIYIYQYYDDACGKDCAYPAVFLAKPLNLSEDEVIRQISEVFQEK